MNNPLFDPNYQFNNQSPAYVKDLLNWYYSSEIKQSHQQYEKHDENYWQSLGAQKALNLFHLMANHVPAYKDFLGKHDINHQKINNLDELQQVPLTDKANYISQYSLADLSWNGKLNHANIISFSSGSTGDPYFWPRDTFEDVEAAFFAEEFLVKFFEIDKKSSLFVNCYSMGIYVAGTYMLGAVSTLAQKGYPITVVSPGINYSDTFKLLKKLSCMYDQVILCGYPPFLKDIVDLGIKNEIDWHKIDLKFFFGSEFFSEQWRKYILEQTGATDLLTSSTNLYGTADAGVFGFETPITIAIKQLADDHPHLNQQLFNSDLTPTFIQYNPALRFFETVNQELVLSSATGIPLMRYNLKDQGNLVSLNNLNQFLETNLNTSVRQILHEKKIHKTFYNLPFLYITNRTDGAVSFYAILIFPEYVRDGLESENLSQILSSKFSISVEHDRYQNPNFIVHVELNLEIEPNREIKKIVQNAVIKGLRKRCAEYKFLEKSIGSKAKPKIVLHKKGDSQFFEIGIKQKWIIK